MGSIIGTQFRKNIPHMGFDSVLGNREAAFTVDCACLPVIPAEVDDLAGDCRSRPAPRSDNGRYSISDGRQSRYPGRRNVARINQERRIICA